MSRPPTRPATPTPAQPEAVVDGLRGEIAALTDRVHAAVRERIELYRHDDVVPDDDLRRSIELNLRVLAGALDAAPEDADAAPRATGRRRARQGAPLPEVLRTYRIGAVMLWELFVARVRAHDSLALLDTVPEAASRLWELADEHAVALTEGFREATGALVSAQERRRSALVASLFTGERSETAGPAWEVGKLLGLPLDGELLVVAAETTGPGRESLEDVETALGDTGSVSAWQVSTSAQAGLVSVRDATHHRAVLDVLRGAARARTGVSPLFRAVADTPRALHLARTALGALAPGSAAVNVLGAEPLTALVAGDPAEAERLMRRVLGPVLDLPADDREALMATIRAHLDHGGSTEQAAEVLHCHPNTVRYRLRRIRELTGRSPGDPRQLAGFAAATEAAGLFARE